MPSKQRTSATILTVSTQIHTASVNTILLCAVCKEEVECLLYKYRCLSPDCKVDRVKFRDILHDHFSMSDDYFMDRVFRAFDKDSDGFCEQRGMGRGALSVPERVPGRQDEV